MIREPDAERDLRQAEFTVRPQEVLGSFNAACDHILVRRQSSGRFELARKVIGAEMNGGSHLLHQCLSRRADYLNGNCLRAPKQSGANVPVNRAIVPHFMSKFEPVLQETLWAREIARHTTTRQKDIRHNEAI